ncbi:MAG TPA: hypothetical protein VHY22_03640 [Chthoniobacteraceae bacterium]|jgi:hypothetical protein|nr:hypothetical protein [Chthoniobacteraceae bacterium]
MIHLTIFALGLPLLTVAGWSAYQKKGLRAFLANNAIITSITPKGRATAVADAAFTSRYLIAKRGEYDYSIAIAGQGDTPYGVVPDMTPTTDTDLSYPLPVNILGLNEDTERMIASGAIAIDNLITTDASGQVRPVPSAAGTYWILGKAKTAAVAQNDQVEIIPCFPYQVTIA